MMDIHICEKNGDLSFMNLWIGRHGMFGSEKYTTFKKAYQHYRNLKAIGDNVSMYAWLDNPKELAKEIDVCSKGGQHDYNATAMEFQEWSCGDECTYVVYIEEKCGKCGDIRWRVTDTIAKRKKEMRKPKWIRKYDPDRVRLRTKDWGK